MPLNKAASAVLETTKRESEARWDWVEASVWTERMLAALGNGVKGGKWPGRDPAQAEREHGKYHRRSEPHA